jgi:hypothetical protein
MRTCGCAAVCVVTKSVDVNATLSIGIVASDIPRDGGRGGLRLLLESNSAGNLRVTSDDSNYKEKRPVSTDLEKVEQQAG